MESAWIRDAVSGKSMFAEAIHFQHIPTMSEYVWVGGRSYSVMAVTHSWDEYHTPTVTIDVVDSSVQSVTPQKGTTDPLPE